MGAMAHFASFGEPGFWLVISALSAVVLLAGRAYAPPGWRTWITLAYWLIIPYLALLAGAVSPRLMGLYWLDWRAAFQVGAGLLLASVLLALVGRLIAAPPAAAESLAESPADKPPGGPGGWPARPAWLGLAGAEEWFWCFLRAAFWELFLAWPAAVSLPLYAAIWAAAALALPLTLALQPDGALRIVKLAALAVTSILFLYTRNFWLCWLAHAVLVLVMTPALPSARRARLAQP